MRVLALCAVVFVACSSSSSGDESSGAVCDPLKGAPAPIVLTNFVAAGKGSDGTIFVVDRPNDFRLFSSEGAVLQRRVIAGSGESGGAITLSVEQPAKLTLKIEVSGGMATRMGVVRGSIEGKSFEIGAQGEVLELVPRATVDTLKLANFAGNSIVESAWKTSGDYHLYVVRPEHDWTYEDFRVFYGPTTHMSERAVISVSRGSGTYLDFEVDGRTAHAFLGSSLTTAPSTLTVDDATLSLTSEAVAPVTFVCR